MAQLRLANIRLLGCHVDNCRPRGGAQCRKRRLGDEKWRPEMQVECCIPAFLGDILDRLVLGVARIIDENIKRSERRDGIVTLIRSGGPIGGRQD